jgi:hypothetical protein
VRTKRIACSFALLLFCVLASSAREWPAQKTPPPGQAENIVLSDKPLQGRLIVEADEKLRIRSDALGKDVYFAIDRYALSPVDGNVYLLDAKGFAVHVFDAAGKQVRVIPIPKGQGPGEFGGPRIEEAYPRKEGLWVEGFGKIALFDDQGKVIKDKDLAGGYAHVNRLQAISPESLLVIRDELEPPSQKISDTNRALRNIQHFELENWEGQSLARYFSSDRTGGWGNPWISHVVDIRITPLILFDYDDARGQRLVYAVSDDYALTVADLSGKTLQTIRRKFEPRKITGDLRRMIMASSFFQSNIKIMKQMGQDFEKMMEMNQTWGHLNPIVKIQFLGNGLIGVFVLKDVQGRFEADVFDRQGRWLVTLQFPEAVQKLSEPRLQGNRLAGLGKNEEDEEFFYLEYAIKNIPPQLIK